MSDSSKKNRRRGAAERMSKLPATQRAELNEANWEHRVTDSADYNGTHTTPDRSGDYEITTDYRRIPQKRPAAKKESR